MKGHLILVLFCLFYSTREILSENILAVSYFASRSHKNVYEPLLHELANRGHKITIVSPYKSSKSHKNFREIIGPDFNSINNAKNMFEVRIKNDRFNPAIMIPILEELCERYYGMPEVMGLLNEKFDLILGSYFWNECTYGLIHKLGAPFILFHPSAPFPSSYSANGNPVPLSFVPHTVLGSTDDMDFKERFINTMTGTMFYVVDELTRIPVMEKVYRKYLGEDLPAVHDIERNVSLILSNSHFSLNFPRPALPDYIEVAGMHCRPPQPLPKDLEDFIQGSGDHGFIYFSMGSVVQAHTMPEKQRQALVRAFSKLKQRVIWKWETETMPDLPANVKLGKWLPQQDILGHRKIRLFITHGGLMSTEEAVHHGVPLVGIPMFGDQDWNMKQSERNGFALTLEFRDLSEDVILGVVNRILTEPRFKQRVKELSEIFRDRSEQPLDKALYWTEYVMRHKGAVHMRSPARYLNFFQYHSLDVFAVVGGIILLVFYTIFVSIRLCSRACVRILSGRKAGTDLKKKTK